MIQAAVPVRYPVILEGRDMPDLHFINEALLSPDEKQNPPPIAGTLLARHGYELRRQLTWGPFHDFYPCPLPDGGLAFISTPVKARYLCWRPQAFVLFGMEADGSAVFEVPAGKVLYFQVLDEDYNELKRMRSVLQLKPGEPRSCIGCRESRRSTPSVNHMPAGTAEIVEPKAPPWGSGPSAAHSEADCGRC